MAAEKTNDIHPDTEVEVMCLYKEQHRVLLKEITHGQFLAMPRKEGWKYILFQVGQCVTVPTKTMYYEKPK